MPARYREKDLTAPDGGSYYHYQGAPQTQFYYATVGSYKWCWDFVGNPHGVNDLTLIDRNNQYPFLNGTWYDGGVKKIELQHLPCYSMNPEAPNVGVGYPDLGPVDKSNAAWEILARTNPNSPEINLPTFIGELKDLPSLVKSWGDTLLKKVSSGNLFWRWVARPMMNDLSTLYDFSDDLNQRFRYFKELESGKPFRRRTALGTDTWSTSWSSPETIFSNGFIVKAQRRDNFLFKKWGSVKYQAQPGWKSPVPASWDRGTFQELWNDPDVLARRLRYGLTSASALATVWELTPWSWFIDWFAGVGTILAATDNTIPLNWGHLCLMYERHAEREFRISDKPEFVKPLHHITRSKKVRKERFVVSPSLPFVVSLPLTNWGHWSVLASLAALRGTDLRKLFLRR